MKRFPHASDPAAVETDSPERRRRLVTFSEALRFWLKLGFISFGGPAGQIAIMHRELVERRRWISEDRFLHALNYCMLLPGPEAQQLATYIGWLMHRLRGGLVAGALFVAPSILVLLGLSYVYVAHGDNLVTTGVLYGFRAVVVAIVVEAVFRIGRRAIQRRAKLLISAAAFAAIYFLGVPFPLIVLGAGVVGWLGWRIWPEQFSDRLQERQGGAPLEKPVSDLPLVVDDGLPAPHTLPSRSRNLKILAAGVAIWLAGWLLIASWRGAGSLHAEEYWFFTKAAFVTFGGAYAVLAYVAQATAGSSGWLTQAQIVDGLALAETTPGPLVMVVQFVGFVAAWNHPEGMSPLTSAVLGALITTTVTFLPCFLFIFLGAPYIESLRAHRGLTAALSGVTAAVVGVILNLALVFGAAVLMPQGSAAPDWLAVAIAAAALLALWRFRVDVLWVILAGGIAGLIRGLAGAT